MKGACEGLRAGGRNLLLRQIRRRFGEASAALQGRIAAADQPTLEGWAEQLVVAATLEEVFATG